MVEVSPVVLFLLGEAVAVLALVVIVGGYLAGRRKRRDKRAIRTLIAEAGSEAAGRGARLRELLTAGYGLEGERLEENLEAILGAERHFLQLFIRLYRRRDPVAASRLHASVAELVAPYHALAKATPVQAAPGEEVPPGGPQPVAARVTDLEAENARLVRELETTRETLDQMLREYARALGDQGHDPGSPGPGRAAGTEADHRTGEADPDQPDEVEVTSDPVPPRASPVPGAAPSGPG